MPKNTIHRLLLPLLLWRVRHISDRVYLILVSVLVGAAGGPGGGAAQNAGARLAGHCWTPGCRPSTRCSPARFYPIIGIALTVLFTRYFLAGDLGRGIGPIIYNIARQGSIVPRSKLYSQLVSSFLTVTFGGSAGLEAPISVTGSAIGSNTARVLRIGRRRAAPAHGLRGGGGHRGHLQLAHCGGAVRRGSYSVGAVGGLISCLCSFPRPRPRWCPKPCTRASPSCSSPPAGPSMPCRST